MYVLHITVFRSVQVIIAVFYFVLVILFEKLCQTGACVSSAGLDKCSGCAWKEAFYL